MNCAVITRCREKYRFVHALTISIAVTLEVKGSAGFGVGDKLGLDDGDLLGLGVGPADSDLVDGGELGLLIACTKATNEWHEKKRYKLTDLLCWRNACIG